MPLKWDDNLDAPPVLDYQPPRDQIRPARDKIDLARDLIDDLGGPALVIFVLSMCCVAGAIALPPLGVALIPIAAVLWYILLGMWVNSSRYF